MKFWHTILSFILFLLPFQARCLDYDFNLDYSYNWRDLVVDRKDSGLHVAYFDSRLSAFYLLPKLPLKIGISECISEPWERSNVDDPYKVTLYESAVELQFEKGWGRINYALFSRYVFRREYLFSYSDRESGFRRVYHGPFDFGFGLKYALVPVARLLFRLEYQRGGFYLAPREEMAEQQVTKKAVGVGFEFSL